MNIRPRVRCLGQTSGGGSGLVVTFESFPGTPPGWYVVCGTSEVSPLFAGILALADQVAHHSTRGADGPGVTHELASTRVRLDKSTFRHAIACPSVLSCAVRRRGAWRNGQTRHTGLTRPTSSTG